MSIASPSILLISLHHTISKIQYTTSLYNLSLCKPHVQNILCIDSKTPFSTDLLQDSTVAHFFITDKKTYHEKLLFCLKHEIALNYDILLVINDLLILDSSSILEFIYWIKGIDLKRNPFGIRTQKNNIFALRKESRTDFMGTNPWEEMILYFESVPCIYITDLFDSKKVNFREKFTVFPFTGNSTILSLTDILSYYMKYKITIYGSSYDKMDVDFYLQKYGLPPSIDVHRHFIDHGQFEGMSPRENEFHTIFPSSLRAELKTRGLLSIFDVPEDFDIYMYKKNNKLTHLTNYEAIFHYIQYGFYYEYEYTYGKSDKEELHILYLSLLKSLMGKSYAFDERKSIFLQMIREGTHLSPLEAIRKTYSDGDGDGSHRNTLLGDFDIQMYRKKNNRMDIADDLILIRDYLKNKDASNVKVLNLPSDFNAFVYQSIYKDLSNLTKEQLEEHYIQTGIHEKRIYSLPIDFDVAIYRRIYKDLATLSPLKCKEHYVQFGKAEGRVYKLPDDFNAVAYRRIYKDLKNMTIDEVTNHYLFFGINEKRIYKLPAEFRHDIYRANYPKYVNYPNHELETRYLFEGGVEAKEVIDKLILTEVEKKATILAPPQIPADFDYALYRTNDMATLKDLTNIQLLKHYFSIGRGKGFIYREEE